MASSKTQRPHRPGALAAPTLEIPEQEAPELLEAPPITEPEKEKVSVRMGGLSLRIDAEPEGYHPRAVHGLLSHKAAVVLAGVMAAKGFPNAKMAIDYILENLVESVDGD